LGVTFGVVGCTFSTKTLNSVVRMVQESLLDNWRAPLYPPEQGGVWNK
jgi:hypothetical protein